MSKQANLDYTTHRKSGEKRKTVRERGRVAEELLLRKRTQLSKQAWLSTPRKYVVGEGKKEMPIAEIAHQTSFAI